MKISIVKKTTFLFLFIFFVFQICIAQKYSTKSRKAIKYFEKSIKHYGNYSYGQALIDAKKAIKKDSNFIEVYYLMSDIFSSQKRYEEKINSLKKTISINPEKNKFTYLNLSKTELYIGRYSDALEHIIEFEKRKPNDKYLSEINNLKKKCLFAINAIKNPVKFEPQNLGNSINTNLDEYSPTLTVDEQALIYTVGVPKKGVTGVSSQKDIQEDFFISNKSDSGLWIVAKNMQKPVNTSGNEGAQSISPDGKILFFTSCDNMFGENFHGKSYGSCDIFYSIKTKKGWSEPENLGKPVNSRAWESQPSFSSDGRTLYFVSNRAGGKGKKDIWKSIKQKNGTWSEPENLGEKINTKNDEQSPFIHQDNKTLYFSSNGHTGMGKYDLFIVRKNTEGMWSSPENLGFPINTHEDQFGLIVNAKGDKAYFSSVYNKGYGGLDIYSFQLSEKNRPDEVSYTKGVVYDAETLRKLQAELELIDMESGEVFTESVSDAQTGEFLICLPIGKNYAVNVSKSGYLFYSGKFSLKNNSDSIVKYIINVPLLPIKKGKSIVLKNILFETDSYKFKKEAYIELNKLFNFLKNNNTLSAEIGGHTDNKGSREHNKKLSNNRARAVYEYLIKKGINNNRLSYNGYGQEIPIADNKTKIGRAENRRTELKIK